MTDDAVPAPARAWARRRVPSTRLDTMPRLWAADHRWAPMASPASCTTASTPSRAAASTRPAPISQPTWPGRPAPPPRTSRTGSCPPAARRATSSEPMSPWDPLTRTFTRARSQLADELVGLGHDPGGGVDAQGPIVKVQDLLGRGRGPHLRERGDGLEEDLDGRRDLGDHRHRLLELGARRGRSEHDLHRRGAGYRGHLQEAALGSHIDSLAVDAVELDVHAHV